MRRREFLGAVAGVGLTWPQVTLAQQNVKPTRIATLNSGTPSGTRDRDMCFEAGLRQLGWIEGKNIVIERRWSDGNTARLPGLAAEVVQLSPDLIVTSGTPATQAMQRASKNIPVVFSMVSDPVASGVVTNLARPEANITGVSNFFPAMIGKLLELIEITSDAKQVAVIHDPNNSGKQLDIRLLREAAEALGVTINPLGVTNADDIEIAFKTLSATKPGALIVLVDGVTLSHSQEIVLLAAEQRLPAIYQERTFVERGGLMSYALNYCQHLARVANYVDKILKGEKPSNLPIEQPSTFQFVVNLKTAKTLGVTLPPKILAFADEVIE
jgi:ABC-type uncharacterized transport system substrate-binding protein